MKSYKLFISNFLNLKEITLDLQGTVGLVGQNAAGKTNILGSGLGLYVAKQIITGLGGKIWAESAGKGKGSTFIVEFKKKK